MPPSSTANRRHAQLEALVEVAERRIGEAGVGALTARRLAADIGIAVGGIYNIVGDLDELALRVSSRTLGRLDGALAEATAGRPPATPDDAADHLVAIAHAYLRFARGNLRLWRMLFDPRPRRAPGLPDWAADDRLRLFRHVVEPLVALLPDMAADRRMLCARTLFAAVHGIVTLGLEDRPSAVPHAAQDAQIEWLVRSACRGFPFANAGRQPAEPEARPAATARPTPDLAGRDGPRRRRAQPDR